MSMGNKKLENRVESVGKSRRLIDRLKEILTVLKRKPDNSVQL